LCDAGGEQLDDIDKAAVIGCQEHRDLAHVFRRTEAAERHVARNPAFCSSRIKSERPGVSMWPGLSTLMRMLRPLRSTIQFRANERTAAFVALQTPKDSKPLIDAIEPVSITDERSDRSGYAEVNPDSHAAPSPKTRCPPSGAACDNRLI
jgi:hypothetical protein